MQELTHPHDGDPVLGGHRLDDDVELDNPLSRSTPVSVLFMTTTSGSGVPAPPSAIGMPIPWRMSEIAPIVTRSVSASGPSGPISGTRCPSTSTGWLVAGFTTTGGTVVAKGMLVTPGTS